MSRKSHWRGVLLAGLAFLALPAVAWLAYDYWHDHRFDALITQTAAKHGLSPFLVKAVVWRESRFEPMARGPVDEIGLMQVRPSTAQEWAKLNRVTGFSVGLLYEPAANLDIGCWYLRRALDRWTGSASDAVPFALAEYNAGRSNALRWANGPPPLDAERFVAAITYPSTRRYVRTIRDRCAKYAARGRL